MRLLFVFLLLFPIALSAADEGRTPDIDDAATDHAAHQDKISGHLLFSYCTQCHIKHSKQLTSLYGKDVSSLYAKLREYVHGSSTMLDEETRSHLTDKALLDLASYLAAKK